jgi:NAD(P)-dependent dehydrogenase (short-subunit alcohol dehydrogenase family)
MGKWLQSLEQHTELDALQRWRWRKAELTCLESTSVPSSIRVLEWNLPTVPNSIRLARWSRAQVSSGGALCSISATFHTTHRRREINAEFGHIDILFANAGIQAFRPLLQMEDP